MSVVNKQTMVRITFDDILQDLRAYLQRVESGETFVILKAGTPVAEIKPITHTSKRLRPYGLCKGAFVVPDDFDAPLPEEISECHFGLGSDYKTPAWQITSATTASRLSSPTA